MNNLAAIKNDYFELCKEFKEVSNYMHSIGREIRAKRQEIERLISRSYFKYDGKTYHVCYEELKGPHKSILLKDMKNGNLVIKIDIRLAPKEKQEELHIMLKRKKCLKYYRGVK
ncbi:MAG: hypothetical protein E6940_14330 [Clostridium septicum]|uniref:hypothetical protein n=1 Tax=Clostridium septicum TaxID=1504 RepID=UPI00258D8C78|nr:hypothetical protein [Clostridium septicum]MDU1315212.1 hypothetical protein [Clostridium septicum]